jgi:hypothetical protein
MGVTKFTVADAPFRGYVCVASRDGRELAGLAGLLVLLSVACGEVLAGLTRLLSGCGRRLGIVRIVLRIGFRSGGFDRGCRLTGVVTQLLTRVPLGSSRLAIESVSPQVLDVTQSGRSDRIE